jgi:excisionase family DNA binding protein
MTARTGEFLTTGEAAVLLGSSRQHVVDLCERGLLPYVKAGAHRRLRRADVEALLRPELTRDQLKALWLHCAVAGRLVADPDGVLSTARAKPRPDAPGPSRRDGRDVVGPMAGHPR